MKSLHDLVAFQRALDMTEFVYKISSAFPKEECYGLTAQIRRASVGVVAQIAEGHGRTTYGEWRQFLSQARGSLFEVESEAIIATRLRFISAETFESVNREIKRTGKALVGLIRWVQKMERSTARPRNRETPQPR